MQWVESDGIIHSTSVHLDFDCIKKFFIDFPQYISRSWPFFFLCLFKDQEKDVNKLVVMKLKYLMCFKVQLNDLKY